MVTVNDCQREAIELLRDQDGRSTSIANATLDALVRKDLARDLSGGNRLRYELTNAGRLLLADVDVMELEPVTKLAHPMDADPFAAFETP